MKKLILLALTVLTLNSFASDLRVETRAGWMHMPKAGLIYLEDADDSWILRVTEGHQAVGDLVFPSDEDFKVYDPAYPFSRFGFWCGKIKGVFDHENKAVVSIISSKVQPLAVCENDPSLPLPKMY